MGGGGALKMVSMKTAQVSLLAFISRTSKWNFLCSWCLYKWPSCDCQWIYEINLTIALSFSEHLFVIPCFPLHIICLLLSRLTQVTRVQTNYWTDKNLHESAFCLHQTSGTVEVFERRSGKFFGLIRSTFFDLYGFTYTRTSVNAWSGKVFVQFAW